MTTDYQYKPADILLRLRTSSPNEGSHDLHCRCIDAGDEIEKLRAAIASLQSRLSEPAAPAANIVQVVAEVCNLLTCKNAGCALATECQRAVLLDLPAAPAGLPEPFGWFYETSNGTYLGSDDKASTEIVAAEEEPPRQAFPLYATPQPAEPAFCSKCKGQTGWEHPVLHGDQQVDSAWEDCPRCGGDGSEPAAAPQSGPQWSLDELAQFCCDNPNLDDIRNAIADHVAASQATEQPTVDQAWSQLPRALQRHSIQELLVIYDECKGDWCRIARRVEEGVLLKLDEQPADRAQRDEQPIHCPEKRKPGGCQLHNLHCGWPECNKPPASRVEDKALHLAQAMAWVHRGDHAYLPQTEEQVSTWQPHAWVLTAIHAALRHKGD